MAETLPYGAAGSVLASASESDGLWVENDQGLPNGAGEGERDVVCSGSVVLASVIVSDQGVSSNIRSCMYVFCKTTPMPAYG